MPVVSQLIARATSRRSEKARTGDNAVEAVECETLFLPHELTAEQLASCVRGLVDTEIRLRIGQMRSALDSLRVYLHIKSRMIRFKARNVRAQVPNTRAREKIDANEARIVTAAEKYRGAWRAKKSVSGLGEWTKEWRELKQTDVRCLQGDDDGLPAQSEGRRIVSWIWLSADRDDGDDAGLNEGVFVFEHNVILFCLPSGC